MLPREKAVLTQRQVALMPDILWKSQKNWAYGIRLDPSISAPVASKSQPTSTKEFVWDIKAAMFCFVFAKWIHSRHERQGYQGCDFSSHKYNSVHEALRTTFRSLNYPLPGHAMVFTFSKAPWNCHALPFTQPPSPASMPSSSQFQCNHFCNAFAIFLESLFLHVLLDLCIFVLFPMHATFHLFK